MIELRLVCECGHESTFANHTYDSGKDAFVIYKECRYICKECGKDMELQVVKIESETQETIIS